MKKGNSKLYDIFIYLFMIYILIVTLYPFLNVVAISFNESADTVKGTLFVIPRKFTLQNYVTIFSSANNNLLHAFFISVARTVIGTVSGIMASCMLAYTLSRQDYVFRKPIAIIFVITMYVSGGMIPAYMLIRNLGLLGSFWVYVIPGLISVFNVIVIRSFMEGLPISLQESARIDGANDLVIFYKIVMPLCLPVIATISLFIAVGQWNSWFDTYLYAGGNASLSTLQFELMKILDNTNAASGQSASMRDPNGRAITNMVSPISIRMAVTIVATVPILLVYPFVQKYFVTGLTLGAVKS